MRDIFTLFLHAIVIVIRLGCRWRWKKGPKQRWSGYFSLCPFPSWKGVFSQNGPQRSRARRCCAAKRTLHGEDRSEILDKRERGGPKWTAKMAQSLTASDTRPWSPRFSPCSGGLGLRSWAGGAPRGE